VRALPEDHYGLSMIGLTATFLLVGLAGEGRLVRILIGVLLSATLFFTIKTAGASPKTLKIASVAIAIAFAAMLVEALFFQDDKPVLGYVVLGALSISAPIIVVKRLLQHPIVTLQTLTGAVVVYVLLGLTFTFLLTAGELVQGPDFLNRTSNNPTDFLYLSFITLTTVGYGDVTPGTNLARVLMIIEAVLAQIFLATVIARFASLFTRRDRASDDSEPVSDDS
jgi:Ion channel